MHIHDEQIAVECTALAEHRNRAKMNLPRRTDQEWLADLTGQNGGDSQEQAYRDLANYLFRVAASYLNMRRESVSILYVLSAVELAELAQDFVQMTLERVAGKQHALLSRYSGIGRFTSWMAQVLRNEIAGELRRAAWQRRTIYDPADMLTLMTDMNEGPEQQAVAAQIGEILRSGLEQLPEHYRIAVWNRIVEGDSAKEVGRELGISANAVNLLVFRGKMKLRTYLQKAGVDAEILGAFMDSPAHRVYQS